MEIMKKFTHNTKVSMRRITAADQAKLQVALDRQQSWATDLWMEFNISKCKIST